MKWLHDHQLPQLSKLAHRVYRVDALTTDQVNDLVGTIAYCALEGTFIPQDTWGELVEHVNLLVASTNRYWEECGQCPHSMFDVETSDTHIRWEGVFSHQRYIHISLLPNGNLESTLSLGAGQWNRSLKDSKLLGQYASMFKSYSYGIEECDLREHISTVRRGLKALETRYLRTPAPHRKVFKKGPCPKKNTNIISGNGNN